MILNDVKTLIHYNPDTGMLMLLPRNGDHFDDYRFADTWNKLHAFRDVRYSAEIVGHRIRIDGKMCSLSRVAYFLHHGNMPINVVNIDGDSFNNSITNLRVVDLGWVSATRKVSTRSTSGYTGVGLRKDINKWRAQISVDGVQKHLGYFDNLQAAITAREDAEITR